MWVFRRADWLNALSHVSHLYGLSAVWTLMCPFRCSDSLNALSHSWHLYGFSPLWILLCRSRSHEVVNRLLQTVHSNGFSPECIRLCIVSSALLWQHFPHSVHLYLLLWIFMWPLKWHSRAKHFPHWVQQYNFSPVWLILWSFKCHFIVNRLSHTVHTYGLGLSSCGCSVISLLSASVFNSKEVSSAYTQHDTNYL